MRLRILRNNLLAIEPFLTVKTLHARQEGRFELFERPGRKKPLNFVPWNRVMAQGTRGLEQAAVDQSAHGLLTLPSMPAVSRTEYASRTDTPGMARPAVTDFMNRAWVRHSIWRASTEP
jgi:hypothetical protein